MWSQIVKQLIKTAVSKGIKFRWATKDQLKGAMGIYNKINKTIVIQKGMSLKETEETITHEIAHALWDLSLVGKQVKRANLKRMKLSTNLPTWLNLLLNYKWNKDTWEEERFAYYMESRPSLVLHLLNQL